ncbi:two-component system sensor histidine kinase NtrB [Xanthomonas arboricola]|uniref:two-component system sensor histidine kinase NtrB n=1 Tax=Xanthomonas arboricola TaxID=56448 RepID=UPI0009B92233|nr:PAS domain-containing sensor histidine kinase [Xanthomonas arboricola]
MNHSLFDSDWYRQAVESSADSIKLLSLDGKVRYVNRAGLERLSDQHRDSAIGAEWVSLWSDDVTPQINSALKAALKGQQSDFEVQCVMPQGMTQYLHISTIPLCDENGIATSILAVNRDITQRRLAEIALQTLNKSLRESLRERKRSPRVQSIDMLSLSMSSVVATDPAKENEPNYTRHLSEELDVARAARRVAESVAEQAQKGEAIGQLLAGVVHDLNNVLQASRSAIELVISHGEISNRDNQLLGIADSALEQGNLMFRRLLGFAANHAYVTERTDLCALVSNIMPLLKQAAGTHVDLEFVPSVSQCFAMVDTHLIERALMNLVINARDACGDSGVIQVIVSTATVGDEEGSLQRAPGEYVTLAVQDDGEGISPEVSARLFEAYFTTKPSGRGTGLGLAQVYGTARQANGFVDVFSVPGEGARFTLAFPKL